VALEAFDVSFSVNAVLEVIVESRMADGAVVSGVDSSSMADSSSREVFITGVLA
jgi:hypothetical protein